MEEPILSRLVRLDNILKHLEDVPSVNHSPSSSCYWSATSSDGRHVEYFSPKGRCRPIEEVMLEVESKGTLIERLVHAEDRILKLEDEFEKEREKEQTAAASSSSEKNKKMPTPKKGLKQLVKSCVVGGRNKNKHKNVV